MLKALNMNLRRLFTFQHKHFLEYILIQTTHIALTWKYKISVCILICVYN